MTINTRLALPRDEGAMIASARVDTTACSPKKLFISFAKALPRVRKHLRGFRGASFRVGTKGDFAVHFRDKIWTSNKKKKKSGSSAECSTQSFRIHVTEELTKTKKEKKKAPRTNVQVFAEEELLVSRSFKGHFMFYSLGALQEPVWYSNATVC